MPQNKFELKSSWYLALLYFFLHFGAIYMVLWIIPQNFLKLILVLICMGSLLFIYRQQVLRLNAKSIVKFWQDSDRNWNFQQRNGKIILAKLQGDSINTLYFVLLNFKEESKRLRRSVMIFSDAMKQDDFRKLRSCLTGKL